MAATSPSSHPHTTHYLRAIVRAHKAPSQPASSPLSVPSDGSPPPGLPPAPSELGDQDEPSSSSASSLSSSPRKASIASSTDGDSSSGGPSGRGRPAQAGGEVEGELVGKVVGLLDDEDEETLKELLRDELGLGYETKVDQILDAHILKLMHNHRDDSNGVPFLASSSANSTPKRPSSRTSNSSLSKTSIPFRPLTPLALHRSQSPAINGGPPSLHAYSTASSSPSPKLHHALPSSPLASPVSSPRTLSAKATEFRPSPKPSHALISPLTSSVGSGGGGADWSTVVSGRAPALTRSLSSNLAIAAPLYGNGSPSLSDDPAFMVNPNASSSPFSFSSPSTPNALTRSSTPRIDDDEDDFSPFGTSLPSNASSSWPPSSSSNSYVHPDQEEADLLEIEWAMQEAAAGGPPTAAGSSMTPMDILSSIFTSLTTHELEVALHKWGYDLDSTMQYLIAAGESGDKASSSSALGAVRAFVPREGYVVAGGRNGSLASNGSHPTGMGVGGAGAILQHGASASRVIGDGIGGGAGGSPSRFGTRSPFGGRVCRYYLQGECRRADCRFSHDIERALCRFWLRGQCAKGEQCEFIHTLPSGFDPQALSNAIANIELSTSPETATSGPSRPNSNTPRTPPPEDFPELGGGTSKGSASSRVPAVKIDAGRARFSSAVKKPLPASLLPISSAPSSSLPTGPKAASAGNTTPTTATPLPRPSARITLRPPSLLPTLPTGSSLNTMYLAARQRAIQYGGLRNQSLSKAADAWRKGDGAAAKRWSKEGQDWNEKMTAEGNEAASRLVLDRRRIVQSAVLSRSSSLSTDPLDRSRKGKGVGNGLGCLLGIASSSTPGAGELTSGEREEALVDLHGLHGTEAIAVLESFLVALETDHFLGLAYAMVGEEKHTGSQDVGRGASKVRLAAAVKVWLGQWGYAWSESRGVLCIDPLTHFDV